MPTPLPPSDGVECTLIGCESQVRFEFDVDIAAGSTYRLEACIDGGCEEAEVRVPPGGAGLVGSFFVSPIDDVIVLNLHGGDFSGSRAVTLLVELPDGGTILVEEEVEFERSQPNGPLCEPVCWTATIPV